MMRMITSITRDLMSTDPAIGGTISLDWVNNYSEGLNAVSRAEHDLCLLDYRLGERTGLELLRESRSFNFSLPHPFC